MSLLKNLKSNTNGSMAITFAVAILMIFACVGVAIDFSVAQSSRVKMQDTADSAVLAAAKSGETTPGNLLAVAEGIVNAHNTAGMPIKTTLNVTSNGRVQVNVAGQYNTYFMGMFGKSTVGIDVVSEAPLGASEPVNIALVLDTTGSMAGSKMSSLKTAATNLINLLDDYDNASLKVSVVPFGQYVNIGTSRKDAAWLDVPSSSSYSRWNGCVGSRTGSWNKRVQYSGHKFPGVMNARCGAEIRPLTTDLKAVRSTISALNASGSTYIPSGIAWGWRALDTNEPFTEARGPYAKNTKKVMIVMTDGANTKSKNGLLHTGRNVGQANRTTSKLCTNVKDSNIEVYTIAYEITNTATKSLMRNCATDAGMYFDASNAAELKAAFEEIGRNLIRVRLTH